MDKVVQTYQIYFIAIVHACLSTCIMILGTKKDSNASCGKYTGETESR